jgi:ribonuclease J
MREREQLGQDGVVVVHLVVDKANGALRSTPEILTRGFILNHGSEEVIQRARKTVAEIASKANGNLQKDVEQGLRTYLYSETHRSPTLFVTVDRV